MSFKKQVVNDIISSLRGRQPNKLYTFDEVFDHSGYAYEVDIAHIHYADRKDFKMVSNNYKEICCILKTYISDVIDTYCLCGTSARIFNNGLGKFILQIDEEIDTSPHQFHSYVRIKGTISQNEYNYLISQLTNEINKKLSSQ